MLPRYLGGRGLIYIENLRLKQIFSLHNYFTNKAETSVIHHAICVADCTPLMQNNNDQIHISRIQKFNEWIAKPLHGRHPNGVNGLLQDKYSLKQMDLCSLYKTR